MDEVEYKIFKMLIFLVLIMFLTLISIQLVNGLGLIGVIIFIVGFVIWFFSYDRYVLEGLFFKINIT